MDTKEEDARDVFESSTGCRFGEKSPCFDPFGFRGTFSVNGFDPSITRPAKPRRGLVSKLEGLDASSSDGAKRFCHLSAVFFSSPLSNCGLLPSNLTFLSSFFRALNSAWSARDIGFANSLGSIGSECGSPKRGRERGLLGEP